MTRIAEKENQTPDVASAVKYTIMKLRKPWESQLTSFFGLSICDAARLTTFSKRYICRIRRKRLSLSSICSGELWLICIRRHLGWPWVETWPQSHVGKFPARKLIYVNEGCFTTPSKSLKSMSRLGQVHFWNLTLTSLWVQSLDEFTARIRVWNVLHVKYHSKMRI